MSTRPNLLLVHCHDLGRYLGCYGRDVETPNLDALAASGVRCTNHFATAPQCSPSRASIKTGKHPQRHGLLGLTNVGDWELPRGETTLPEHLRDAGYETHLFGLQHEVRDDPARLGYDAVHGGSHAALEVTARFADAVDDLATGGPFFADLGFFEPHLQGDHYRHDGVPDAAFDVTDPGAVEVPPYLPDEPPIRRQIADLQDLIAATVDEAVGRIRAALREVGVAGETLIAFVADHGLALPRAKGTCYDAGLESALLLEGPGVPEGEVISDLLSNVDVLPTLLDLLDCEIPGDLDGRSFAPRLAGEGYEAREAVFAGMTWHGAYVPMRAVRTERYKYVRNETAMPEVYMPRDVLGSAAGQVVATEYYTGNRPPVEFYDLEADPHEQTNLVEGGREIGAEPHVPYQHAPAFEALGERLAEWRAATGDPLLDGDVPAPNPP